MSKRELLAKTLESTGLGTLFSRFVGGSTGLVVLNYHRVGDPSGSPYDRALWSATADQFDRQVRFLKKNFDVVRIADLDDLLQGRKSRGVLITFDDGYLDNYELAFPILKSHNASATFFITSGFLDDRPLAWWDAIAWMVHTSPCPQIEGFSAQLPMLSLSSDRDREHAIHRLLGEFKQTPEDQTAAFLKRLAELSRTDPVKHQHTQNVWMSWEMVRNMDRAGMDIGGHTVTHPVLSRCDPNRQTQEIVASKLRIEEELGHLIAAFSYPVGQTDSFTNETKAILTEAGYRWAFSFYGGFARSEHADVLDVPREAISPDISDSLFRSLVRSPKIFARPRLAASTDSITSSSSGAGGHFPNQNAGNVDVVDSRTNRQQGPVLTQGDLLEASLTRDD
ncbi:MAG: polysaccharide deacetylase family protein [Planctomycetaceae bacterium]|nr:polysaccharide deacetylase family protein [Planctomycetaceae bacterium]